MSIFLGFDTSNYTTSVAAYGEGIVKNNRKLLEVKKGERGLRQSNALFAHVKALPDLFRELSKDVDMSKVCGVGISIKPRNAEGSYMPVFLSGSGYGNVVAASLGVPVYEFSHQDGHIMAGIISGDAEVLLEKEFLSVHLSGGTTEILKSRYNGYNFDNEIIGGTKDISAGQLIDRTGVLLGLDFPCGKELEKLSEMSENVLKLKLSVDGGYLNYSGAETALTRMSEENKKEDIAYAVISHVAETLAKSLNNLIIKTGVSDVLIVGGVASNKMIRTFLNENVNGRLYYAEPEYSTDNAVGIAALAAKGGEIKNGAKNGYGQSDK